MTGSKRRRRLRLWHILLAFVVVLLVPLGAGVGYLLLTLPDVSDQLPPDLGPILVTLSQPLNGSEAVLGVAIPVEAVAVGEAPVQSFELWVNGALVESQPGGGQPASALWAWAPAEAREYTLSVRALDASGASAYSNLVRVRGVPASATSASYPVQPGQTLIQVAEETGLPADQVAAANPGIDPNAPLPGDQPINIPAQPPQGGEPPPSGGGQPPPPPPEGPLGEPPKEPNNLIFWINMNLFGALTPPAAPIVAVQAEGCGARLSIGDNSNNETGFFIYRAGPGDSGMTRIATLGAHSGAGGFEYVDGGLQGALYLYYVAAFNAAGETPGNLGFVELGTACGGQVLDLSELTLAPVIPVDKAYCYVSQDNILWTRIPAVQDAFLPGVNGVFHMEDYLQNLGSSQMLAMSCWGWQGGELMNLGNGETTLQPLSEEQIGILGDLFTIEGLPELKPLGGGGGGLPSPQVAPPYNLRQTFDPAVCMSHLPKLGQVLLGGALCESAVKNNQPILVFEWMASGCWPGVPDCEYLNDIDGFRLYEVGAETNPPGQYVLVSTKNDPTNHTFFLPPLWPKQDGSPHCYAVQAFSGDYGSPVSNVACLGSSPGTETVLLQPAAIQHYWIQEYDVEDPGDTCGTGVTNDPSVYYPSGLFVDNYYYASCGGNTVGGMLRFDLAPLANRTVAGATLRFEVVDGLFWKSPDLNPTATNYIISCMRTLEAAVGNSLVTLLEPGEAASTFAVDVTNLVRWNQKIGGMARFYLEPGPLLIIPPFNYQCQTEYGNARLEVTLYPQG